MKKLLAIFCIGVLSASATLVSIGGVMPWPAVNGVRIPYAANNTLATFGSLLLDATGEKAGFVVQVPAGCTTIQKIGFRTTTVTTGDTLKLGVYTIDSANGDPTATAYGGMTTATQVVADGDDNTFFLVNNGDASSTPGDLVGVVAEFNSYVAGNLNIAYANSTNWVSLFPYADLYTGAWTKAIGSPLLVFECQGGVYFPIVGAIPFSAISEPTYDTVGGENDEGGNVFSVPFKGRAVGAWFYGDTNANFTVKLYDSDGSQVLASVLYDVNNQQGGTPGIKYIMFDTFGGSCSSPGCTLSINTEYRITILAADSTGGTMSDVSVSTAAMMGALPGGAAIYYTTRDGGGSWSNTTTRRAIIGLLFDQLDDGAGAAAGTRVY